MRISLLGLHVDNFQIVAPSSGIVPLVAYAVSLNGPFSSTLPLHDTSTDIGGQNDDELFAISSYARSSPPMNEPGGLVCPPVSQAEPPKKKKKKKDQHKLNAIVPLTSAVEDDDGAKYYQRKEDPPLQSSIDAGKERSYPPTRGCVVSFSLVFLSLSMGIAIARVESWQAAGYATHVASKEALVLRREGRVAVGTVLPHLGGFPRRGAATDIGRTRPAAVDIQARTRPPTTRYR